MSHQAEDLREEQSARRAIISHAGAKDRRMREIL